MAGWLPRNPWFEFIQVLWLLIGEKAQQWNVNVVTPEPEEIAEWIKTEIQIEGKSAENAVPQLVLVALAKMKVTKKEP